MKTGVLFTFLFSLIISVLGQDAEFPNDPYLKFRPEFARSLPVQIMLTGVVLTLVAVLLIHLMFTAQYHWPLAPVNYVLQLSGVTTLLISLIATIHVVLSATFAESENWPYMLNYIAVNVPPLDLETNDEQWSTAERATWLVMNASTSGLIQITHIQFLTLLYPSRLEGRLIFALLGPLAIVAAVMQLLPISNNTDVSQLSTDVRNVCNATLSLLFTLALFIWGLLVNRDQAWRTDGGTAVFGCAALSLAVVSTALNFLYVHKEEDFVWLPSLMWAVVLWQSFLGWWWWVGAGSGRSHTGEYDTMEEKVQREAKRERRKKEARERRRETKLRAKKMWRGVTGAFVPSSALSSSVQSGRTTSDILSRASSTSPSRQDPSNPQTAIRRTRTQQRGADADGDGDDVVHDAASQLSRASSMTVTATGTGATTTHTYSTLPRALPNFIHRFYASLRREHNAAARVQAAQRVERMREMGRHRDRDLAAVPRGDGHEGGTELPSVVGWGWGWHGFGWRRRNVVNDGFESGSEKTQSFSRSRSLSRRRGARVHSSAEYEMQSPPRRRRHEEPEEDVDDMYVTDATPEEESLERMREPAQGRRGTRPEPTTPLPAPAVADNTNNSIWWWGPLKRWRLQDSTTY